MKQAIYLTGSGQTRFGEWWDKNLNDLMREAMDAAIVDADINPLEIDTVIVANMLAQESNGQAHLGAAASALLPHNPPALRVESACASGAIAAHTATALLESGRAETVLIVGVEKMTDVSGDKIAAGLMGAADSELDSPSGLTFPGIFGLIAKRYMYEYGLTRDRLSAVSARHHANATKNPFAQFRGEIPIESIAASPLVADPLCMLDCSPISDGAAACILSTKHESKVTLAASQLSTDTLSITQRATLLSFEATKKAAAKAFEEAGVSQKDIDVLELHDCFSIAAIINLEDLGFANPGEGVSLYEKDQNDLLINKSGGLKACGHPVAATGIKQLIDVSKHLKNNKKKYGLAHNFGGAAASCAVHILHHA